MNQKEAAERDAAEERERLRRVIEERARQNVRRAVEEAGERANAREAEMRAKNEEYENGRGL